jgi:hypothetical protein
MLNGRIFTGVFMGSFGEGQPAVLLTSWKEIAAYMDKAVRTVQRWERDYGLPVRRPLGTRGNAVLARPRDLDEWVVLRCGTRLADPQSPQQRAELQRAWTSLAEQIRKAQVLCRETQLYRAELEIAIEGLRQQIHRMRVSPRSPSIPRRISELPQRFLAAPPGAPPSGLSDPEQGEGSRGSLPSI